MSRVPASAAAGPAVLLSSPKPVSVQEDEPATLNCSYRAMGPPVTQTRWLRDGEPVKEVATAGGGGPHRYWMVEQPGTNSSLVFRSVQLGDRGSYVCEVLTRGFRAAARSEPALLGVREKLKFSPEPVNKRLELNSTAKVG